MTDTIVDVQGQEDLREQTITKVGIKDVAFRSLIKFEINLIPFQGTVNCFVFLDANKKGTHMSRMARGLIGLMDKELTFDNLQEISSELFEKLETSSLYIEIKGEVIRNKKSPINDFVGYEKFDLGFNITKTADNLDIKITIGVIGTSLCPASKINSKAGAHNQRSLIKVELPFNNDFDIAKTLNLVEGNFSTKVYPILKLDDESFVTEDAYKNPKFVEDIVRDVAASFNKVNQRYYQIECENFESIHTHNAYGLILNS